jgi:hypothetical protein
MLTFYVLSRHRVSLASSDTGGGNRNPLVRLARQNVAARRRTLRVR